MADRDWGTTAGTWLCFRSGDLASERGLFFADSYDGAWPYAVHGGKLVVAYEVTVERVLVAENQYALLARHRGTSESAVRQEKQASRDPYWLRKLDAALAAAARRAGHDAILYTRPTTPTAERELVALDPAMCLELGECGPDGQPPARRRAP